MLTDEQREERDIASIEMELMAIDKEMMARKEALIAAQDLCTDAHAKFVVEKNNLRKVQDSIRFLRDRRMLLNGVLRSARTIGS